jgi:site-specific recombinase XerD
MSSEFPFFVAPESPRLELWRQAFQDFITYRNANFSKVETSRTIFIWRQFLQQNQTLPWQVDTDLLRSFVQSVLADGKNPKTANKYLISFSNFYNWCIQHVIDPQCPPNFNPARDVERYKCNPAAPVTTLTTSEANTLLTVMRQEGSILSQRDYALTLLRLLLGDPNYGLLQIKWGSLQFRAEQVSFTYDYRGRQIERLIPEAAWQSIRHYLQVSGRLPVIGAGDYLFATLVDGIHRGATGDPRDWDPTRHINSNKIRDYLQRFARLAKLGHKSVNMTVLRYTAIVMRFEAGATIQQLMDFTCSDRPNAPYWYIRRLFFPVKDERGERLTEELPHNRSLLETASETVWGYPPLTYARQPPFVRPGTQAKHGLARIVPIPDHLLAKVMAEGPRDLGEEIHGLQQLTVQLYHMSAGIKNWSHHLALAQTYSDAVGRLTRMQKVQDTYLDPRSAEWLQEARDIAVHMAAAGEIEATEVEQFPWENLPQNQDEQAPSEMIIQENIARMRLMMRQAMENSYKLSDPMDFARLVDKYSSMGVKLANLMAFRAAGRGGMEELRERTIEEALIKLRELEE